MTYTLVFPENASIEHHRISVLAPIGTAMLGQREGDEFDWEVPAGRVRLKVTKVLYQPEAANTNTCERQTAIGTYKIHRSRRSLVANGPARSD